MRMCAGCEGDEGCQIQFDIRNEEYGCQIPERFRELISQARVDNQHRMLYQYRKEEAQKKLESIKKYFEERERGDIEVLWIWNDIKKILEGSEFTTKDEDSE